MRLDELAQAAGVPTTTVRLYQTKGLLPPPRLVGRTGYYDRSHVARLGLIARLQSQGFSLAGIGRLLETWAEGRDRGALVGVESTLHDLLGHRREVVLGPDELLARFPEGSVGPDLVQRAASMGLVEPTQDGRFRVADERFLDTGASLMELGVPGGVVLDEWAHLRAMTDEIAERFIDLFETHLLPAPRRTRPRRDERARLAETLAQLRRLSGQVLAAALDASIAERGTDRLGRWLPPDGRGSVAPPASR